MVTRVFVAVLLWAVSAQATTFQYLCQSADSIMSGSGLNSVDSAVWNPTAPTATTAGVGRFRFDSTKIGPLQNVKMKVFIPTNLQSPTVFFVPTLDTSSVDQTTTMQYNASATVLTDNTVETAISGRETNNPSSRLIAPGTIVNGDIPLAASIMPQVSLWNGRFNTACTGTSCGGHWAIVNFERDTTVANNTPVASYLTGLCLVYVGP